MATPSELVRATSEALALPEGSVALHYRHLREAGLVSRAGRGRGAPTMTATDAAWLLLSICATDLAKDAAKAAQAYWRLRAGDGSGGEGPSWRVTLPYVQDLPRHHSLGDMVEALIKAGSEGAFDSPPGADYSEIAAVSVRITSPGNEAWVFFAGRIGRDSKGYADASEGAGPRAPERSEIPRRGLNIERSFFEGAISVIGKAIGGPA